MMILTCFILTLTSYIVNNSCCNALLHTNSAIFKVGLNVLDDWVDFWDFHNESHRAKSMMDVICVYHYLHGEFKSA